LFPNVAKNSKKFLRTNKSPLTGDVKTGIDGGKRRGNFMFPEVGKNSKKYFYNLLIHTPRDRKNW